MSEPPPNHSWTTKRRMALVLAITKGDTTVDEAAREHGLDPEQIADWQRLFLEGAAAGLAEPQSPRTSDDAASHGAAPAANTPPDRPNEPPAAHRRPQAAMAHRQAQRSGGGLLWIVGAVVLLIVAGVGIGSWWWLVREPSNSAEARCQAALAAELQQLRRPMKITLYATPGLPAIDEAASRIDSLMETLGNEAGAKLSYRRVTPETDQAKEEAEEAGLQEAAFGSAEDDTAVIARGYFGMVFEYESDRLVIPVLNPDQMQGIGFWIGNKIRELRARVDDLHSRIGVLTGLDEIALSDTDLVPAQGGRAGPSIQSVLNQAMPLYEFVEVDVTAADRSALGDLQAMIVTQPGRRLSADELRLIDDFVMLGDKTLLVFASAVNVPSHEPAMKATLDLRGLDELLAGYGIEMRRDLVLDPDGQVELLVVTQNAERQSIAAPALLLVRHDGELPRTEQRLDDEFAAFFHLDELAMPYCSSLVAHPDRQPEATYATVARSTRTASVVTSDTVDLRPGDAPVPTGEKGQRELAMVVAGKLQSAFGDEQANGRVFVVASSQFTVNPLARAGNPPAVEAGHAQLGGDPTLQQLAVPYARAHLTTTILALKNSLDWATADETLLACSATLLTDASDDE